ncbi:hypothetical protein ACFLXB_07775 [Chloroflexota bacterium]
MTKEDNNEIETILADTQNSILLVTPAENPQVVIGVPHHAPLGVPELPCCEHPMSDENTGFIGYHLSRLLNCPAIIACNYFMDSNKHKGSDYYRKLLSLKPKILIEIHGHCSSKVCADIEISSGRAARDHWSQEMAARLQVKLTSIPSLQEHTVSGDFTKIHFKATKSVTITSAKWVPFHLELPWPIRKSQTMSTLLAQALAETIRELLVDFDDIKHPAG